MALRKLTQAEVAAARLRIIARDLLLEAEELEASVGHTKTNEIPKHFKDPTTGKKTLIKFKELI